MSAPNGVASDWTSIDECPICHHRDKWCRIKRDGTKAICRRGARGAYGTGTDRHGATFYRHRLSGDDGARHDPGPARPIIAAPAEPRDRADPDTLHEAYSALLGGLSLSPAHRQDLGRRGFPDAEVDRLGYRSVTRFLPRSLLPGLHRRFGDRLLSVPGFAAGKDNRLVLLCRPGLLIPVRDVRGRIIALKSRPDSRREGGPKYLWVTSRRKGKGGPSPGSPAHVPLGVAGPAKVIRITEGEIKADLATALSGVPTISAAGATNWRPALASAKAIGCEAVRLAYDNDLVEKKEVAAAALALAKAVRRAKLGLEYEHWGPEYKGIDDALAAGDSPKVVRGAEAQEAVERDAAQADPGTPRALEAPDDPHRLARIFLDLRHCHPDGPTLRHHRGQWWAWGGSRYRIVADSDLSARLNGEVKREFDAVWKDEYDEWVRRGRRDKNGEQCAAPMARKVHTRLISDTLAALASRTLIPGDLEPPAWLIDDPPFPPAEIVPCRNGLVHLPGLVSGEPAIVPPTPALFATHALDFDFDPDAPQPTEWLKFLKALWPADPESIGALQEWFGLCLTADTSHQKIFALIGPTRCGKGTIAQILTALVGPANTAGPTLSGLATNFGAESLIGKPLAVIANARLTGKTDQGPILERLLSISGEDRITIDRKYREAWIGRMPTRLMILSNVLPKLLESSEAIAGRLVILRLTESFLGREDRELEGRLRAELPGILLWALRAGWQRLRERGHFVQPKSGEELAAEFRDLSSPVGAFVHERCRTGSDAEIAVQDLYSAYRQWCETKGLHPSSEETFSRDLYAAIPTVTKTRPREGERRVWTYSGIKLI